MICCCCNRVDNRNVRTTYVTDKRNRPQIASPRVRIGSPIVSAFSARRAPRLRCVGMGTALWVSTTKDTLSAMPPISQPFCASHVFGRHNFEKRLQMERLQMAITKPNIVPTLTPMPRGNPVLASPRSVDFATAFAKPDQMSSPRVHYAIGSGLSPRHHSHFSMGSSPVLKAGTRMGWWPNGSGGLAAWRQEEPYKERF